MQTPAFQTTNLRRGAVALLAAVLLPALAGADTYRWQDADGVWHYSDNVPPDANKGEREVVNEHGVTVDRLPAEPTAEELRQREMARMEAERKQREIEMQRKYDQSLLHTYLSVADIEALRDSRLETLASRLRLNEHAVRNLRTRMLDLEERASKYNYPYDPESDKIDLPEVLASDLLETIDSLSRREQEADQIIAERETIRARFDSDIERFRYLKGETAQVDSR